jgi:phosphoglycolate phosphatase-like HAD superfamily hydrolase
VEIAIDPKAVETRDESIENAALIVAVSNQQQATIGADALRGLRAVSKAVETSRIAAKAPVLELGKRIDAAAKTFTLSVDHEVARITALLTAYEVEQRRIAAEAERQRQEEERRRQAEEAARLSRLRFEKESLLAADLIGAEGRLLEARLRHVIATADERIALVSLRRALGLDPLPQP